MRLEPDRFHTWDLAVPGGVYRVGSSRSVFAAQAGKTGYPAYFVRNGGGYHAGGQRVEPVAAGHSSVAGQGSMGAPGAGAYFRRCGAFTAGGDADAVSGALALSLGIGLQNIPEGAAVSLPLTQSGRTRGQSFAAGAASGLVEPLGAVLAFVLAEWVGAALPWLMSAAAGCMVCVTAQEMIPEAVEPDEVAGVISIVLGFALMMALDVAL